MKIFVALLAAALALLTTTSYAGTNTKKVCHGELTDMRAIGLGIGDCDLNSISDKELERIKSVCGEPWGPSKEIQTPTPLCRIEALVGPEEPNFRGALVFPVKRVLTIKAMKQVK